jgi:hypothetical protein
MAKATPPHNPHTAGAETPDQTTATAIANLTAGLGTAVNISETRPSAFAALIADADIIEGHSLESDKSMLIGVPFVITGITVRDGVPDKATGKTNYLSVEATVADEDYLGRLLRKGRLTVAQMQAIDPLENIVFNDGSTGIARQLVQYLHNAGLIVVPDGPESGAAGACRWDFHYSTWKNYSADVFDVYYRVKLFCPRGLRDSRYETEYAPDGATTYYLA